MVAAAERLCVRRCCAAVLCKGRRTVMYCALPRVPLDRAFRFAPKSRVTPPPFALERCSFRGVLGKEQRLAKDAEETFVLECRSFHGTEKLVGIHAFVLQERDLLI